MSWWTDPFRELEELRRELFRTLDTFLPETPQTLFLPGLSARSYPLVNVYEDPETFKVYALAPGIDPDTIDVSVLENQVTIRGEKKPTATDVKPENWHRNERAAGRFIRTFDLPMDVDPDKVEAVYSKGILEVILPKAENAVPKRIKVKVG